MKPKNNPTAASEKVTGKPISMNTTSPANISGAIHSRGITSGFSLQRPFVVQVGLHVAGDHGDALDQFGNTLEREQRKADRQQDLYGPADQAAGVRRDLTHMPGVVENRPRQVRQDDRRRQHEQDEAED